MYYHLQAVLTEPKIMWLQDSTQHQTNPTAQITDVTISGRNSNLPLGMNTIGCTTSINTNTAANMKKDTRSTLVNTVLYPPL
mmetsp:Transcript_24402/g.41789  ORF Transcript_24402/g.41789 Transcript_24402/m.41789 type:complete len:82 (+) Transcript_24402:37-282(+)